MRAIWRRAVLYAVPLALGVFALEWLEYRRLTRAHADEIYMLLIAAAFLALGVYVGARLFAPARPAAFDGNPQAVAALGVSPRELAVLQELAAGRSNKEIARRLGVSPNTVKTHVARLYAKLQARRRTEAVNRARALGIVA